MNSILELNNIIKSLNEKNYFYFFKKEEKKEIGDIYFITKVEFFTELEILKNEALYLFEKIKLFKNEVSFEEELVQLNFQEEVFELKHKIRKHIIYALNIKKGYV